jgi:hypothetical protein
MLCAQKDNTRINGDDLWKIVCEDTGNGMEFWKIVCEDTDNGEGVYYTEKLSPQPQVRLALGL